MSDAIDPTAEAGGQPAAECLFFPAIQGIAHRFVLRHPALAMDVDRSEALRRLAPWHERILNQMGYQPQSLRTAEQVHGNRVAVVDGTSECQTAGVDGLITQDARIALGIYVADCCAVYLHDPVTRSIGLVHAGRKGAELGIVPTAIEAMSQAFGVQPGDIIVQLSPCIRPPAYEVDFAATVRVQALGAGVQPAHLHDCGVCTSSDLRSFYSYRIENGRTGRMLALLALGAGV